jgi:cyclophilin family peptidyl-prolyl cis-trans isomerase
MALFTLLLTLTGVAAPVIDPLPNVTVPAGKSLILPITATATNGRALTYTITSSTNAFAVVPHTNNPFWQLTLAQVAANAAPGAYQTPFRGGLTSVTNVGTLTFMLFPEYAPYTVNVFQGLTTAGFYNSNTIFHRVIANFVIQGGDPQTNGSGGLVFQYNDEFHPQAIFTGNGQLALANSGPDTDGSQFFVTVGQQRSLDFDYTLFGQLVRGFVTLTNIDLTPVDANDRPRADEIIQTASYVSDPTDTVITLTATNVSGVAGKITVIADDSAGGRATNTFTATTVTDASSNNQPIIYPGNTFTNLVAPRNGALTNYLNAVELDGETLYWNEEFGDQNSLNVAANYSLTTANGGITGLTYHVTNTDGQAQFVMRTTTNYAGSVNFFAVVSSYPGADQYWETNLEPPNENYRYFSLVFGDTPIVARSNTVTVLTGAAFTNALLATFTNGVPLSAPTNFTAYVYWGDDSITAAAISTNGAGQKVVLGTHQYTWPGTYPALVELQSAIGASANLTAYVTALGALPRLTVNAATVHLTNGFTFSLLASNLTGFVQISTNLSTWTTLTNFTATNGSLSFRDPATNLTRRFYRLLIQ